MRFLVDVQLASKSLPEHVTRTHDLQVAHPTEALVRKKEKLRC